MSINATFHADAASTFEASFVAPSSGRRAIKAISKDGEVCLFMSDEQARKLAKTILDALAATLIQEVAA